MIRDHLTYANVMATLSFFVAVGGVGYAAATIDSGDVVNNSLRSNDLKNDKGVKSPDVPVNALTGDDIDEASLDSINAERLVGVNGSEFARSSGRRQTISTGFSSQPVVTSDAAGLFQLFCNDPDAEPSELRFYAPASGVAGAGDRDSWVTLNGGPPSHETLATDPALPEHQSVTLDPSISPDNRVVWQISPLTNAFGEVVTATFSISQANTTNAPCETLGHAVVGFTN
jgi:hypothetical protein